MKYDLHIHSCLSPCGDEEMTPNNIVGMAHLAGLDVISVCDHNSAKNLEAVKICAQGFGLKLLPGIEVCTQEEIHLLCYFSAVDTCVKFGEMIYDSLPPIKNKPEIYGRQSVLNSQDEILYDIEKLLIVGCGYNIYEAVQLCHNMGGKCFYAHADKNSFSILSVLGAIPNDLPVDGVEIFDLTHLDELISKGLISLDMPFMSNSDAHSLEFIGDKELNLPVDSPLYSLISQL
ncbi:MAG: PHP domain-containing protein [Oscillospiraceae bacterium]